MVGKVAKSNPFFPVNSSLKYLITGLLAYYWIFSPLLSGLINLSGPGGYNAIRFFLDIIIGLLKLFPFLYIKRNFGLLHPLIFIPLIGFLQDFIRFPIEHIMKFSLDYYSYNSDYFLILSQSSVVGNDFQSFLGTINSKFITIIALVTYYLAYFSTIRVKPANLKFNLQSSKTKNILWLFFGLSALYLVWYIWGFYGGLETTLLEWRGGRGQGPVKELDWTKPFLSIPLYILILQYVFSSKLLRNPFFIISFVTVNLLVFFVEGSRSGFLISFLFLTAIYVIRTRKIPWLRLIILSVLAYASIGVLGAFRSGISSSGSIDWDILITFSLDENFEETYENQQRNLEIGDRELPIFTKVPWDSDLLWGRSYIPALTFFIPSAVWKEKPNGPGKINGRTFFGTRAGIPVGTKGEAYWNFWYPGVIIIFILFGRFHKWLGNMLVLYGDNMLFLILYFLTLYRCDFHTVGFISYLQMIIPLLILLYLGGALRILKSS